MAFSPIKFLRESRGEITKVVWPTRAETIQTTIMVFIVVTIASLFFFTVDIIFAYAMKLLLGV